MSKSCFVCGLITSINPSGACQITLILQNQDISDIKPTHFVNRKKCPTRIRRTMLNNDVTRVHIFFKYAQNVLNSFDSRSTKEVLVILTLKIFFYQKGIFIFKLLCIHTM